MHFYISDTHFGHANIIGMCQRPFASVEEMDEYMIARWNERVSGNDTVFILGDMFYRCGREEEILARLSGKKWLIEGNHDGSWLGRVDLARYFVGVDKYLEISDGTRGMTLCHYPLLTWKHAKKNYMIHGHIHLDTTSDFWPLLVTRQRTLNAGADLNGFAPVTFEELLQNNEEFKRRWEEV